MALIICPECKKGVSDKAITCPNCGYPIETKLNVTDSLEILQFPSLPDNLSIGDQIVNWGGDSAFSGEYQKDENVVEGIQTGKVKVVLHTHGIRLADRFYVPLLDIHNSQIISINRTSKVELLNTDKSVIGRAVVGGLILGPLGAVVGGMSGIGTKQKIKDKSFLVINYWDINTKSPQTLLVGGRKIEIELFARRNAKENEINQTQNRQANSKSKGCLGVILIPLAFALVYFLIALQY